MYSRYVFILNEKPPQTQSAMAFTPFLYTPLNKMTGQLTFDAPVIY